MRCYAADPAVGANSAPQTSWLDFGERKGMKKGRGKGKGEKERTRGEERERK